MFFELFVTHTQFVEFNVAGAVHFKPLQMVEFEVLATHEQVEVLKTYELEQFFLVHTTGEVLF